MFMRNFSSAKLQKMRLYELVTNSRLVTSISKFRLDSFGNEKLALSLLCNSVAQVKSNSCKKFHLKSGVELGNWAHGAGRGHGDEVRVWRKHESDNGNTFGKRTCPTGIVHMVTKR